MFYLYSISIELCFVSLILFLIRVFLNKKNINFKSNKYNWKLFISIIIINMVPIINLIFMLSSAYASTLMKKEKFIEFMNE
jgi:tellurite resistance protein TehA-like permease